MHSPTANNVSSVVRSMSDMDLQVEYIEVNAAALKCINHGVEVNPSLGKYAVSLMRELGRRGVKAI